MTKKQKALHIQKIKDFLLTNENCKEDRFGHIKMDSLNLRIKFQKTSIRIERKISSRWFKITGAYFKDISFSNENGKEAVLIGKLKFYK